MPCQKQLIFYGDAASPLLAPRGVCLHGNVLVVSDTGQNRVFVWKNFSYATHQPADIVLGQANAKATGRNAQGAAAACTMQYPSGVWTNGQKLIVADAWNHRVLIWHSLPTQHGQPADVVVGQQDFTHTEPNGAGIGAAPKANSLYWPYGVWSLNNALWIADTGNRRVLYFSAIPTENWATADGVIGQPDMHSRDYDGQHAIWPYAVKTNEAGRLLITDTQYYRVMLWQQQHMALQGMPANVLIGQPDFGANGQNQYGLKPAPHTLNWTYDACFTENGLAVADTGNSRILHWNQLPEGHNLPANDQLGQPDFCTNGESSLSMKSKVENEMYWPFSVQYQENMLVVADTGNHRLIFYTTSD
ncbi:MAG: hypothetical protein EAY75_11810 [Bacteroidetes bacterium]|nr:MAG: hypothetical protein EAY75_11810 [Bacteroidota bacterium]